MFGTTIFPRIEARERLGRTRRDGESFGDVVLSARGRRRPGDGGGASGPLHRFPVTPALLLALGFVLLVLGGELLVRGASRLALVAGLSPLVVGLTVVAFGTSAPEMGVSVIASLRGEPGIALGNVVGSNVFNVLAVLGASALVAPLVVSRRVVRREVPLVIAVSGVAWLLAADGGLGKVEGGVLVVGIVAYTWWTVRESRRAHIPSAPDDAVPSGGGGWLAATAAVLGGLALLVLGSRWLVEGASSVARSFGVSETVVGLTVVAAGTSLPEAVTSIMAAARGQRDIAVGNVLGSNLFNLLGILGCAALLAPGTLSVPPEMLAFDLPVMTAVAVACLPVFFTGHEIARWEGGLFLGYYLAYVTYLVLAALGHAAMETYGTVMWAFVLPLTATTLAVVAWREWRGGRKGAA
jgi:cation:H+ antiporter